VPYDVVVVGLGLAGLVAALAAASQGPRTLVVGAGYGTLRFRSGTIDVLGYWNGRLVDSPAGELATVAAARPDHPYAIAGEDLVPALEAVRTAGAAAGLALEGLLQVNRLVATSAGTLRPTCLAPASMRVDWSGARVLVAGLAGYRDFSAELVAGVLPASAARHGIALTARAVTVDLPSLHRRHLGGLELARAFEQPEFRREVVSALRRSLADASLVALPAVVGLEGAAEAADDVASALGVPIVELPTLPPSVPGIRLELALTAAVRGAGAVVQVGSRARLVPDGPRVGWIELEAPGRPLRIPTAAVVLASGGLASGGLVVAADGSIEEPVAGLPVRRPAGGGPLFGRRFLEPAPAGLLGVRVDGEMRALGEGGGPAHENLFVAGGLLAGADRAAEKCADGVSCATGWRAGGRAAAA
jgi:glycerol-3-phosphate dehydrogenase subunit B